MTRSIRCPNCGYALPRAKVSEEVTCFLCGCRFTVWERKAMTFYQERVMRTQAKLEARQ